MALYEQEMPDSDFPLTCPRLVLVLQLMAYICRCGGKKISRA